MGGGGGLRGSHPPWNSFSIQLQLNRPGVHPPPPFTPPGGANGGTLKGGPLWVVPPPPGAELDPPLVWHTGPQATTLYGYDPLKAGIQLQVTSNNVWLRRKVTFPQGFQHTGSLVNSRTQSVTHRWGWRHRKLIWQFTYYTWLGREHK